MTTLKSIKEIKGYELAALDGQIGNCLDFLFDDNSWAVRYLVVDTNQWLPRQKVLISPISIGTALEITDTLSIGLTRNQIQDSPPLEADTPVSRQYETTYNKYHGWGNYWEGPLTWGHYPFPRLLQRTKDVYGEAATIEVRSRLRSTQEVIGYSIEAIGTEIGQVEDFVVDEETWIIRYLVVDTSNWLPAKRKVILSPSWVDHVDWSDGNIIVNVAGEKIKDSPEYHSGVTLDRDYEISLCDFYNLPYYW